MFNSFLPKYFLFKKFQPKQCLQLFFSVSFIRRWSKQKITKINNKKPKDIATLLKENMIEKFPEFKNIFIAEPGFLNIEFTDNFWQNFLTKLLNLKEIHVNMKQKTRTVCSAGF